MAVRRPITPNPGGTLSPDQVIGRDDLINRYWDILSTRSMVLLAPRRLGKTSVCRRMSQLPREGFVARYRDLEDRTAGPLDLARALFEDTEAMLKPSRKVARRAKEILAVVGDTVETTWAKLHVARQDWRPLLDAIFSDLDEWATNQDVTIVLFWDEFPLFLHDLADRGEEGAAEAMALLDRLRAARQRHPRIRMVYTGSIGLDEVIRGLHRRGYANDPDNDMAKEVLPLLDPVVAHVAGICEGHPFLIQHVADRLRISRARSRTQAEAALSALLDDAADPLELSHYVGRLERYLGEPEQTLAMEVLDALSLAAEPLDLAQIGMQTGAPARDSLLTVLRLLRRDLYIERTEGRWSFRLEFLRRYWKLERGL